MSDTKNTESTQCTCQQTLFNSLGHNASPDARRNAISLGSGDSGDACTSHCKHQVNEKEKRPCQTELPPREEPNKKVDRCSPADGAEKYPGNGYEDETERKQNVQERPPVDIDPVLSIVLTLTAYEAWPFGGGEEEG